VTLVDDAGRPVDLREALAADEPVMLNFIFTTCTAICPVMTGIFARVPEELGAEAGRLRMVSISIDPEQDTPSRLRAYGQRFGAGPRWSFLTGSAKDVEAVERAFDAYRGDKMNHEPLTLLRAGPGRPWIRIDGFASPAELAREYERALGKVALR
jgi:protein SCO1/2